MPGSKMELNLRSVIICLGAFLSLTHSERLHEQIYSSIEGGAACFRRLNGTHQSGCSSSYSGTVGVVHMINNIADAQWMVTNGNAGPYVAVVSTALFPGIVEILMGNPLNVAGVLLYDNDTMPATSFTQESRCPNEYYSASGSSCSSSLQGGIVWNEKGTDMLRRDVPFPMLFLPKSNYKEIEKIEQCYQRYNLDRDNQKGNPLCSLQLRSFMYAAVNSEVCMRRSLSSPTLLSAYVVCHPLGDNNVYYSLFPRGKETSTTKTPVHLITARIDTASFFDGVAPGAASSVVGMVTLITAAVALSKMIPVTDAHLYKQNILWTLLNGEAFDYIGSQRVAYDISRGAWPPVSPLSPSDVTMHVELGQLGGSLLESTDNAWPLFAFSADENTQVKEFLTKMSSYTNKYNMSLLAKFSANLPPSSLHSFRRILKNVTESGQLPELVIVDHQETFTNKFYHSELDEFDKIGFNYHNISVGANGTFIPTDDLLANGTMKDSEPQVKISRLATAFAMTLYKQVTDQDYSGTVAVSAHLVDEMLYCFLKSQACRLLIAADYASNSNTVELLPTKPAQLSVGVLDHPSTPPVLAGHLLALLTGTHLQVNKTTCDSKKDLDFSYYWLRGWNQSGICVQTTMNFSQALSPAFMDSGYDYKSGLYSTWTESVWDSMWARVFVTAGGGGAQAAAVAGAFVTIFAAVLTYWLQKHASIVFPDASIANGDTAAGILRSVNC